MGWEVPGIKNWIKTNLKGGNQKGKVTSGLKMLGGWGGEVKSQGNFEDDSQREPAEREDTKQSRTSVDVSANVLFLG